jgi:hypothetical protein
LGEFHLAIDFQGRNYEIEGKGGSRLAGALYRGSGNAASTGTLTKAGPQPSSFTVSYKGGGKEQRRMSRRRSRQPVTIVPRKKPSRNACR